MSDVEVRASPIEGLGLFAARPFCAGQRIRQINVVREVTPTSPLREELGERATAITPMAGSSYWATRIDTSITVATPMPMCSTRATARSSWPAAILRRARRLPATTTSISRGVPRGPATAVRRGAAAPR